MKHFQPQNSITQTQESEPLLTMVAGPEQIERLATLGVLTAAQLEAGRKAGGLAVSVPARLVKEFQANSQAEFETLLNNELAEIEKLVQRINAAGLNRAARLFIGSGRPLSFFASQLLLMAQPVAKLTLGQKDFTGQYSRLLEKRSNLDYLLIRLEELNPKPKPKKKERP